MQICVCDDIIPCYVVWTLPVANKESGLNKIIQVRVASLLEVRKNTSYIRAFVNYERHNDMQHFGSCLCELISTL